MPSIKYILSLLALVTLLSPGLSQEEPVEVERSKNKVIIDGKVYYIHVVKEGQTLYSISHAYNVTQKEIAAENPEVMVGLKEGQTLKIPERPVVVDKIKLNKSDKFIYHIISEGQTLYFLSRHYNISIEDIFKHNPELEYSNLQVNQVIKIPREKVGTASPDENIEYNEYIKHRVERGETLYSLSKLYDVTIEQIINANREGGWRGLKYGEYLLIPKNDYHSVQVLTPGNDTVKIDTVPILDTARYYKDHLKNFCDSLAFRPQHGTFNIAVLLPLYLNYQPKSGEDTLDIEESGELDNLENAEERTGFDAFRRKTLGFLEFYEGVLLGLDELKKEGYSVNLHLYDTENNPENVYRIVSEMKTRDINLIIGPVFDDNIEIVAKYSNENKIPLVLPFFTNHDILIDNPYLIQVIPSRTVELDYAARFLSNNYDKNLVYVHSGDSLELQMINEFKDKIFKYTSFRIPLSNLVFKQVIYNDTLKTGLKHALTNHKTNLVIIPSEREEYVSEVVRFIDSYNKEFEIRLFGFPTWPRFNGLETEALHAMNMVYFTPFYVDQKSPKTINFYQKFESAYGFYPWRITSKGFNMGMIGHDIISYFVKSLGDYRDEICNCIPVRNADTLESKFAYIRENPYSGLENNRMYFVEYTRDYEVKIIDKYPKPEEFFDREFDFNIPAEVPDTTVNDTIKTPVFRTPDPFFDHQ
ncbi:MAG: LysM peptidoglycan-binding domain-containing protein [bacterium]